MPKIVNLASNIKRQLPAELVGFMQAAGQAAQSRGERLYLVGGVVRDLLLGRTNLDLDLVVDGNAINLANQLSRTYQGKIMTHPRFGTAKLQWDGWSVDIATARSETYARPGALPIVKLGSIKDDLARRDFTINAMAVLLGPDGYGELLDPFGGRDDLGRKLVRILHQKSFIDDATRIWRGLRYEQRLSFQLEQNTLRLIERDVAMLGTISGDRIRHELELALKEESPEKIIRRADELGVLAKLHPSLKGDSWLEERFAQARRLSSPDAPSVKLYMALLACRLSGEESGQLISYLRLPKTAAQTVRDTVSIKSRLELMADPELAPSRIYSLLYGFSSTAIMANSLAADSPVAREHIDLFLNKLRYVKSALTGEALKRMGVPPGPRIKEILNRLREARLDGKVNSRKDEERLVEEWVMKKKP
ncbi:CCA tRNA nucleotidyltransferase [Chloroflexota bacterium]